MKDTLTTTEAANMLGFHVNTLKNWVRDGKMPAFKTLGGHYRIRKRDFVRVLRENGIPVPSDLEIQYTIFVVDDDSQFQAQLRGLFGEKPGTFDVRPFLNGYDALVEIGRKAPDMLLLNVRISSLDGFQFLSKLKNNPDTEALKIVAVSSNPEDAGPAQAAGASAYFCKTDGLQTLVEKMSKTANDKYLEFPQPPAAF